MQIVYSTRYKKYYKTISKRGYDISLLDKVIKQLLSGSPLDKQYRDHKLTGNYVGYRECHIKPDWLLIYSIDDEALVLLLMRTGSPAELFRK